MKYKLSGDIVTAVFVEVEADSLEDAIDNAEAGHYKIVQDSTKSFTYDGTAWDENEKEIS